MKRAVAAFSLLVLVSALAWAQDDAAMRLTAGTWQVGGSVTVDIDTLIPSSGDTISGFKVNVTPSAGYFVQENLMVAGEIAYQAGFGDLYDVSDATAGFGLGAHYYLPIAPVIAHFGAILGMSFTIPETGSTTTSVTVVAPLGALVPLNAHVALDVGLRVSYSASLDDADSRLSIPFGYLGVQAFF